DDPRLRVRLRILVKLHARRAGKNLLLVFARRFLAQPEVDPKDHSHTIVWLDLADTVGERSEVSVESVDPLPVVEVIWDFLIIQFKSDECEILTDELHDIRVVGHSFQKLRWPFPMPPGKADFHARLQDQQQHSGDDGGTLGYMGTSPGEQ